MLFDIFAMSLTYIPMWFSLILIGLGIYRLSFTRYISQMIYSTLILTFASVCIQTLESPFLLTVLMPVVTVLCFMHIFKFGCIHSIFIATPAFAIGLLVELLSSLVLSSFHWGRTISHIQGYINWPGWIISGINFILAWSLHKYRLGFSYLNVRNDPIIPLHAMNKKILFTTAISAFIILQISIILYLYDNLFYYTFLLLISSFFILVLLLYQKDLNS